MLEGQDKTQDVVLEPRRGEIPADNCWTNQLARRTAKSLEQWLSNSACVHLG